MVAYRIFALLSACAYIPTGRKSALNKDVRLISRCVLMRDMRLITRKYGMYIKIN